MPSLFPMNIKSFALLAFAVSFLVAASPRTAAQTAPAATPASAAAASSDVKPQLQALVQKINTKLQAGAHSESDLAPELKEFDAILAAHKGEKSDDLAQVAFMKAQLYLEVFDQADKALPMLQQLVKDFPDTAVAKQIAPALPQLAAQIAADAGAAAIRAQLAVGTAFPDFSVKDLAGKPLSVANYKGKVVLVDFWATWCGPCVQEMPNVIAAYGKYHDKGFEIIGVSLDDDADKGRDKLTAFITQNKMPWVQYYDGKHWQTDLAVKYGVHQIPTSYLLDGTGKIIALSPRGPDLAPAIEKALATLAPVTKPAN